MATVSSSEARVDALKNENEELTARMQELQIERKDYEDGGEPGGLDPNDAEIIEMNQQLTDVIKDQQQLQERFKKVDIVNDQISNWARRCFMKLGTLT